MAYRLPLLRVDRGLQRHGRLFRAGFLKQEMQPPGPRGKRRAVNVLCYCCGSCDTQVGN